MEESPVQHVEKWIEHDRTLCTNRISHGHFQLKYLDVYMKVIGR